MKEEVVTHLEGTDEELQTDSFAGYQAPDPIEINWSKELKEPIILEYIPIEYVITTYLNGEMGVETYNYTIETETFSLNNPVREGYAFAGWTNLELEEPVMEVIIEKGSTGDKV